MHLLLLDVLEVCFQLYSHVLCSFFQPNLFAAINTVLDSLFHYSEPCDENKMKGTVVLHDVAKILVPWLIKLFTEHPEDQA